MDHAPTRAAQHPTRHMRLTFYCCCGIVLALMGSLGLLVLRMALTPDAVTPWHEFTEEAHLYLYVFCFTSILFITFGAITGRREDDLRAQSITDPLTGLVNRRYFSSRLNTEIKRCGRTGGPLALLLIDVDHLKTINDTQGHSVGDTMLRAVASCIQQVCRSTDVLARLGGDEFAVLAPGTAARQGVDLANRLRGALKAYSTATSPLSVSIGVSDLEQVANLQPEALLGAADMALYAAKDSGRDCVFVNNTTRPRNWSPLPSPPSARREALRPTAP